MDTDELKVAALLDEISRLTVDFSSKIANLRVQITLLTRQLEASQKQVERLRDVPPESKSALEYTD